MSYPDMVAWWDSDRLTVEDKIEWCGAAVDGLVATPLADTLPPDALDEWLTPVEPGAPLAGIDELMPLRVYEMSADLVAFIDANC